MIKNANYNNIDEKFKECLRIVNKGDNNLEIKF